MSNPTPRTRSLTFRISRSEFDKWLPKAHCIRMDKVEIDLDTYEVSIQARQNLSVKGLKAWQTEFPSIVYTVFQKEWAHRIINGKVRDVPLSRSRPKKEEIQDDEEEEAEIRKVRVESIGKGQKIVVKKPLRNRKEREKSPSEDSDFREEPYLRSGKSSTQRNQKKSHHPKTTSEEDKIQIFWDPWTGEKLKITQTMKKMIKECWKYHSVQKKNETCVISSSEESENYEDYEEEKEQEKKKSSVKRNKGKMSEESSFRMGSPIFSPEMKQEISFLE